MRRIISVYFDDWDSPLIGRAVATNRREERKIVRAIEQELLVLGVKAGTYRIEADQEEGINHILTNLRESNPQED